MDPTFTHKNVVNALKDVVEWKLLGDQLNISAPKIKEIDVNNQGQVANCRRDLVQFWLESDVSCSWKKLTDALKSIHKSVLAEEIIRTYCPMYQVQKNTLSESGDSHLESRMVGTNMPNDSEVQFQSKKDYYTIALLGRTGLGKSTTGNKLLHVSYEIDGNSGKYPIREWRCSCPNLLKWSSDDEPKAFKSGGGTTSVTKLCQILSNEQSRICVMDIPGFADTEHSTLTAVQRHAGLVDSILKIQHEINLRFNCVLYFLPSRGYIERSDAYLQDELKILFYYFGECIFKCMVMVATKPEEDTPEFNNKAIEKTMQALKLTMQNVTKETNPICPPLVFIPFNATHEEIYLLVKTALGDNDFTIDPSELYPDYAGDKNWEQWIEQFESAAAARSHNSGSKIELLKRKLTGGTKAELEKVIQNGEVTYDFVKSKLQIYIYSKKYDDRKKQLREGWKAFLDDLHEIAKRAFPDLPVDMMGKKVANKIRAEAAEVRVSLPDDLSINSIVIFLTAVEQINVAYAADDMGKGWKDWIENFDDITTQRSLDDCTKLQWLKARLTGEALTKYNALPQKQSTNYTMMKQLFSESLFNCREKVSSETWDTYNNDLHILAAHAYPNLSIKEQEDKILEHFLCHVKNLSNISRKWSCFNDAYIFIAATTEVPIKYADYTGESWKTWLADFETACNKNQGPKLEWLKVCICKKLLPLFEKACIEGSHNYTRVVSAFHELLMIQVKFDLREKSDKEDWKTLYKDLNDAAQRLVSEQDRDKYVLRKLMSNIETKGITLIKKPRTCTEALTLLCVMDGLKGDTYCGEGSYEKWIKRFDSVIDAQGSALTDSDKIMLLKDHLKLYALNWFQSSKQMTTYNEMKQEFQIKLLGSVTMKSYDKWKDFAEDLTYLAESDNSIMDSMGRKVKALELFLNDPMMKRQVRNKNPTTIDLAVTYVEALEHINDNVYSDKTGKSWKTWLKVFNNNCPLQSKVKIQGMVVCISDELLPLFERACNEEKDYDGVVDSFYELLLVQKKFKSRKKSDEEDWKTVYKDLNDAAQKLVSEQDRDNYVLTQLMSIIKTKGITLIKIPTTCTEALTLLCVKEELNDETYCGKGSYEKWIKRFDSVIAAQGSALTESDKIMLLKSHLRSNALKWFRSSKKMATYNEMKQEFQIKLLGSVTRKSYDKWKDFAEDLTYLAESENSIMDSMGRKVKALELFLNDPMMKHQVRNKNPTTIDLAVTYVEALEHIKDDVYCDKTGETWKTWLKVFNNNCPLESKVKIQGMVVCISDELLPLYEKACNEAKDYDGVVGSFYELLLAQEKFKLRKKSDEEDWNTLYKDLNDTAQKLVSEEDRDNHVLTQLMSIIKTKGITLIKIPATCTEALALLCVKDKLNDETYSGEGRYEKWIKRFDSVIAAQGTVLTDSDKIMLLQGYLRSNALKWFQSSKQMTTYNEMKQEFQIKLLGSVTSKSYDRWDCFASDLTYLAESGNSIMGRKKALERFLNDPMMKHRVRKKNPTTIELALTYVEALEHIKDDVYCDKTGETWKTWLKVFNNNCPLESKVKIQGMVVCISDELLPLYEKACNEAKDYDGVVGSFYELLLAQEKFKLRKKSDEEDWKTFYKDLNEAAQKMLSEQDRDKYVLSKLMSNIETKGIKLIKIPTTCTEALTLLCVMDGLKGDMYCGEGRYKKWIKRFDSVIDAQGSALTESDKIMLFRDHLRSNALKWFQSSKQRTTYNEMKQEFHIKLLGSITRKSYDEWKDFAEDLTYLAESDNSVLDSMGRKKKSLQLFLNDPMIKREVRKKNPTTIELALTYVEALEHIKDDVYCDKTGKSWETWLKNFDNNCPLLEDKQKIQGIAVCINDELLPSFLKFCAQNKDDYILTSKTFGEYLKFNSVERRDYVDWKALYEDLNHLATAIFPEAETEQMKAVLDKLLSIMKCCGINLVVKPETSKQALDLLSATDGLNKNRTIFSDDKNYEKWIVDFESIIAPEGSTLTDLHKAELLKHHLKESSLELFNSLPSTVDANYIEVKEMLIYGQRFKFMQRASGVTWKDFAEELSTVAKKAFPKISHNERDMHVLKHFLDDPMMKQDCRMQDPLTTENAISIITDIEIFELIVHDKYERIDKFILRVQQSAKSAYPKVGADGHIFEKLQANLAKEMQSTCTPPRTVEGVILTYKVLEAMEYKYFNYNKAWDDWIEFFEGKVKAFCHEFNDDTLLQCFEACILKQYTQVEGYENDSYESAKNSVTKAVYAKMFESRVMKSDESWEQLADDLRHIAKKAYSDKTDNEIEVKVLSRFVQLSGRDELKVLNPTSINEAIYLRKALQKIPISQVHVDGNNQDFVRREIYVRIFDSLVKETSWEQLADDLRRFGKKAYSDQSDDKIEEKVLTRFLALSKDKFKILKPTSTNEALSLLEKRTGFQFESNVCTKCCLKRVDGQEDVLQDQAGNYVFYYQSKCHGEMIDKYTTTEKFLGGTAHVLTLGVALVYEKISGKEVWPGYINSDKVCKNCEQCRGFSSGCLPVNGQSIDHFK